jgi:D-alanine-D-alanine ligase-like ATP-grasp enzyme
MQKRVGILRGGMGENYGSSIKKGGELISHILENLSHKYKPVDILIDKGGQWHISGVPIKPADLMHRIDVAWNTAHHDVFPIIENLSIPYIGQEFFHGAADTSKEILREHMKKIGVQMPRSLLLPVYQEDFDGERNKYAIKKAKEVFEKFPAPWIVKSFTPDINMGIHLAKTFPELVDAIEDGVKHEKSILVEEFIAGKIASVHSVPGWRGQEIYTFPINNYMGNSFGVFSNDEKEKLSSMAKALHKHLHAKHYLKSDFVLSRLGKSGQIYLLNLEWSPDLGKGSHFSEVCESAMIKPHQITEHIIERAL